MEHYAPDQTFVSDRKLKTLAAQLPTPFYLYDAAGIRRGVKRLNRAFSCLPSFCEHFPVHLCPYPEILTLLRAAGCGVLCRSPRELRLARQAGFSGQDILYAGLDEPDCACVRVIDDEQLLPQTLPKWALLRYNPSGKLTFGGRTLCALDRNRLGMPKDAVIRTAQLLKSYGVRSIGLSFSGASNDLRTEYLPAVAELLFTLAAELHTQHGILPYCCCLGDGLGVPLRPETPAPELERCAEQIALLYREIILPAGIRGMGVRATLGRWVLAPHALFVTHVLAVKAGRVPLLITDAAATQFAGSVLNGNVHHISVAGKTGIAGRQVCAVAAQPTLQLFSANSVLPPVQSGAALVFHTAGCAARAYAPAEGFAPAAQYLLPPDGEPVRMAATAW